jgi:hypothetical protein
MNHVFEEGDRLGMTIAHHVFTNDQEFRDHLKYAEPARRLRKGRSGTHIVHFPSLKNNRTVVCESTIEADFALRLEHDPDVIGYLAQPETFKFTIGGVSSPYTPDFLVYYQSSHPIYFEIKPHGWDLDKALSERLTNYQAILNKQGVELRIVSEHEIRIDPLMSNLQRIYSRIHQVTQPALAYLSNCLEKVGGKSTVKELRELSIPPTDQAVMHALFYGPAKHIQQRPLDTDFVVELS